jgi:hypothetical protein
MARDGKIATIGFGLKEKFGTKTDGTTGRAGLCTSLNDTPRNGGIRNYFGDL